MKKSGIISSILCLTLLLSILPLSSGVFSATVPTAELVCDSVARPGEKVSIALKLSNADSLMAVSVSNLQWDTDMLHFESAVWSDIEDSGGGMTIKDWDQYYNQGVMAFQNKTNANTTILEFTFTVVFSTEKTFDTWLECDVEISYDGSKDVTTIPVSTESVRVAPYLRGDVNGDNLLDNADPIYLLYHVHFGKELYPLKRPCDADRSGALNADDAVYLLYAVLYPDLYSIGTDNSLESYFGDLSSDDDKDQGFGEWKPLPVS